MLAPRRGIYSLLNDDDTEPVGESFLLLFFKKGELSSFCLRLGLFVAVLLRWGGAWVRLLWIAALRSR
jgi:hypothetical protein